MVTEMQDFSVHNDPPLIPYSCLRLLKPSASWKSAGVRTGWQVFEKMENGVQERATVLPNEYNVFCTNY